jgi:hypothetical protein
MLLSQDACNSLPFFKALPRLFAPVCRGVLLRVTLLASGFIIGTRMPTQLCSAFISSCTAKAKRIELALPACSCASNQHL